jgi:transcriptional regulator of met regulon
MKRLIYWNDDKTNNVKMKSKRWKHIRNYSIIIYNENAMEIGNKDTQYNVRKMKHATITQRYKCLLHVKFGNQPYPDDIKVYSMLSLVISHTPMI